MIRAARTGAKTRRASYASATCKDTEPRKAVERARAQLVAYGALGLPIVPALLMLQEGTTAPEVASTYLWACFLVLQYHQFTARLWARLCARPPSAVRL